MPPVCAGPALAQAGPARARAGLARFRAGLGALLGVLALACSPATEVGQPSVSARAPGVRATATPPAAAAPTDPPGIAAPTAPSAGSTPTSPDTPSSASPTGPALPPLGSFSTATLVVETDGTETSLPVYVADTPQERQRGLMGVEDLPDGAGMLFAFDQPSTGGFWMKDTLIPLSIAFLDEEGRALAILDMQPCETDPCPVYTPGVTYVSAVEVEQGWFDEAGIEEGDRFLLPEERTAR